MPFINLNHVKRNAVCTRTLLAPIAIERFKSAYNDNRLSYTNSMLDICEEKTNH